jgi:integrase
MGHSEFDPAGQERRPWNAGRMVGAKKALKPQQVWAIRFWLDSKGRMRDRAMFDLAIDSKLRGCDIVRIRIGDLVSGGPVRTRATVTQQKTGRPVQFELLESARGSLHAWLDRRGSSLDDYAFPSRTTHLGTSAPGNMPVLLTSGSRVSACDPMITARIRLGERRRR